MKNTNIKRWTTILIIFLLALPLAAILSSCGYKQLKLDKRKCETRTDNITKERVFYVCISNPPPKAGSMWADNCVMAAERMSKFKVCRDIQPILELRGASVGK